MLKYLLQACLLLCSFISMADSPMQDNQAFQFAVKPIDGNFFLLTWQIQPNYFLYKDRIKLLNTNNKIATIGPLIFPKATTKQSINKENIAIYRSTLTISVPIHGLSAGTAILQLHYQGCSDAGFCYPPVNIPLQITIDKQLHLNKVILLDNISTQTKEKSWSMLLLLSFYGVGLLLTFTPCVLPMIPILSGIIVGRGHKVSTQHAFLLSLSYVISMSLTYSVIGGVIALMGHNLQIIMQSNWSIATLSGLFVILALSMFDLYTLSLPKSWQKTVADSTQQNNNGHYMHAALMGALSILVLSPCVTAPMLGALGLIAQTGNITIGLLAFFSLGLGMGTPLLLIGTSAGKLLPKAGLWMNDIKHLFGFIFIAIALYLMTRMLPAAFSLFLWGVLLIVGSIYYNTFSIKNTTKIKQSIGAICFIYGCLMIIGAALGNDNPLQPLKKYSSSTLDNNITVTTLQALNNAIKNANGTSVMVDFYASWCESCMQLQKVLHTDPELQESLKNIQLITVDITDNTNNDILKHFNIIAPPALLFFNDKGDEIPQLKLAGYKDKATLIARIKLFNEKYQP